MKHDNLRQAESQLNKAFDAVRAALEQRMEAACVQYSKRNPSKTVTVLWAMGRACCWVGDEQRENAQIVKVIERVCNEWGANAMITVCFTALNGKVEKKYDW